MVRVHVGKRRTATMLVALVLGLITAIASGLATGAYAASSAPAAPQAVATGTPPDPQLAQAVATWITQGGEANIKALAADFGALEKAAGSEDMTAIVTSCKQLGVDVRSAQAYAPIPDPQAQNNWSAALVQYADGANDCANGATNLNAGLLDKASSEITAGSNQLNQVTARMTQIAGG